MRRELARPNVPSIVSIPCYLLFVLLSSDTAGAQTSVRLSGWPLAVEEPEAEVSMTPEGVHVGLGVSDPARGLTVRLLTADPLLASPPAHAATRTAIGPIRWMAPEAIRVKPYSAMSITAEGHDLSGLVPWSARLDFVGEGEVGDAGPLSYTASLFSNGLPVDAGDVVLRLIDGNGESLHESRGQGGQSALYQGSTAPTGTSWTVAPLHLSSLVDESPTPFSAESWARLRMRLHFEEGTVLSFFDPDNPGLVREFTVLHGTTALEMDQELDPIIGGSLSSVAVQVVDHLGGPLTMLLTRASMAATGQPIEPVAGTTADLWLDADGASVLQLTPSADGHAQMQTAMEPCVQGVAFRPIEVGGEGDRAVLRLDGTPSRLSAHVLDGEGALARRSEVFFAFDALSTTLRIGVSSSDPQASAQVTVHTSTGSWVSGCGTGEFCADIQVEPIPGGGALPPLPLAVRTADAGDGGPGTVDFAFAFDPPRSVILPDGEFAAVHALVLQLSAPPIPGSGFGHSLVLDLALEGEQPVQLAAAKEWVKPCPSHVMCSARGLGRAEAATFGDRGVYVGNVGRGALTGGSAPALPGGVRLDCVDGGHARIDLWTAPVPSLSLGGAWQFDVRAMGESAPSGRAFARLNDKGVEIGFDLAEFTELPAVQVERYDASGALLESSLVEHGAVAFESSDPVVSFHVDSPGHSDYIKFSLDLGLAPQAQGWAGAPGASLAREHAVITGRIEGRVFTGEPVTLDHIEVLADGPASFALLVGDAEIGVSAPPHVPGSDRLRIVGVVPNPFNPLTEIRLALLESTEVSVRLFDARGRLVRTLHEGPLLAGAHLIEWDGCDDRGAAVASGVYLVRAEGEGARASQRKLALVR